MQVDDIRKIIAENVIGFDVDSLSENDNFNDAGIDSLDLQSILLSLQEVHGMTVADEDIDQCQTISGIIALFKKMND
jgi:acyl carrier protein